MRSEVRKDAGAGVSYWRGWRDEDEFVETMVPRIGYRATAAAIHTDAQTLRREHPGLGRADDGRRRV